MKTLAIAQRSCLAVHIASLVFGLAGLILVLPHPEFIASLSELGQTAFQWSMAGGGAVYMIAGAAAVSLYAYRNLGMGGWLGFLIPAVSVSLAAELIGTSTGFPFGHYSYLSGLGYKVAGLVPFTIPLSWFYMGMSSYLLAYRGLASWGWWRLPAAVATGAVLLTSWDFVLDPAMSQAAIPFWAWDVPGAFFGMPYQNFVGWFGTGALFMGTAAMLWRWQQHSQRLQQLSLGVPLAIYLSNFAFAMLISVHAEIYPPIFLGILLGIAPAVWLYWAAGARSLQANGLGLEGVVGDEPECRGSTQESTDEFERLAVPSQGEV